MAKNRLYSIECWHRQGPYSNTYTFNHNNTYKRLYASEWQDDAIRQIVNKRAQENDGVIILTATGWTYYQCPLARNEAWQLYLEECAE